MEWVASQQLDVKFGKGEGNGFARGTWKYTGGTRIGCAARDDLKPV